MNVIQEIKDLKRRFNFLRKSYETYEEPQHEVKRYKAFLDQLGGTDDPTVNVFENNFEVNFNWVRGGQGNYVVNNYTFLLDKTFIHIQFPYMDLLGIGDSNIIEVYNSSGTLTVNNSVIATGNPIDGLIRIPIYIEVYP